MGQDYCNEHKNTNVWNTELGVKNGEFLKSMYEYYPTMVSTISEIVDTAGGILYDTYKGFERIKNQNGFDKYMEEIDKEILDYDYLPIYGVGAPLKSSKSGSASDLGDGVQENPSVFRKFVNSLTGYNSVVKDPNIIFNFENYVNCVSDLRIKLNNNHNRWINFDIENFPERDDISKPFIRGSDRSLTYKIQPILEDNVSFDMSSTLPPTCNYRILLDMNKLIHTIIKLCKMPDQIGETELVTLTREDYITSYISTVMHKMVENITQTIISEVLYVNLTVYERYTKFIDKCTKTSSVLANDSINFQDFISRLDVLSKLVGMDASYRNHNKLLKVDSFINDDVLKGNNNRWSETNQVHRTNNDLLSAINDLMNTSCRNIDMPNALLDLSKIVFRRAFTHCFETISTINIYKFDDVYGVSYFRDTPYVYNVDAVKAHITSCSPNANVRDFYDSVLTNKSIPTFYMDPKNQKLSEHNLMKLKNEFWVTLYGAIYNLHKISIPLMDVNNVIISKELTDNKYYIATIGHFAAMVMNIFDIISDSNDPSGIPNRPRNCFDNYRIVYPSGSTDDVDGKFDTFVKLGKLQQGLVDCAYPKSRIAGISETLVSILGVIYSTYTNGVDESIDGGNNKIQDYQINNLLNYKIGSFDIKHIKHDRIFEKYYSISSSKQKDLLDKIKDNCKIYIMQELGALTYPGRN